MKKKTLDQRVYSDIFIDTYMAAKSPHLTMRHISSLLDRYFTNPTFTACRHDPGAYSITLTLASNLAVPIEVFDIFNEATSVEILVRICARTDLSKKIFKRLLLGSPDEKVLITLSDNSNLDSVSLNKIYKLSHSKDVLQNLLYNSSTSDDLIKKLLFCHPEISFLNSKWVKGRSNEIVELASNHKTKFVRLSIHHKLLGSK